MGTQGLLHNWGDFSKDPAQGKNKLQWSCVLEAPYGSETQRIQFLIPSSAVAPSCGRLNRTSSSGDVQNCHCTMPNTKSLMRLFLCFMGCRAITYFLLWLRVGSDCFSVLHHLSKIIKNIKNPSEARCGKLKKFWWINLSPINLICANPLDETLKYFWDTKLIWWSLVTASDFSEQPDFHVTDVSA